MISSYLAGIKECSKTDDYLCAYNTAKVNQLNKLEIIGRKAKFIQFILSVSPKFLFKFSIKILWHII